jgi:hypothetical protein
MKTCKTSPKDLRALNRRTVAIIRNVSHRPIIPPLQAGEGRGEGESLEQECHTVPFLWWLFFDY